MKQVTALDVQQFIDEGPFSRYQLQVVIMCGALVFMDGFDAQAMGFVAPALIAQLHITRYAFGPALSSGLFGMMIGAFLCGPLADRFGRKPVLVGSALIFGLGALLTASATSLESLVLWRLLTGFGLGGAMPNAIALTAEYAPTRVRATAITTMFTGFSLGAAVGGFLAAALISRFGWQSVFILGGTFPLVIAILLWFFLPESIRFLLVRGASRGKVASHLARIVPDRVFDFSRVEEAEHPQASYLVMQLFTEGRATLTICLWVLFFMNLMVLYFLNSWLPTILHDKGMNVETAIVITTLFQIGGCFGAVILGRILDRTASFWYLACVYCGAAVSIILVGQAGAPIALVVILVFIAGFCVVGGQTSSNALTAELYPTEVRSTGLGWALGMGRVGSIVSPMLGGMLLSMDGGITQIFWAAAIPTLVASIAAAGAAVCQNKLIRDLPSRSRLQYIAKEHIREN